MDFSEAGKLPYGILLLKGLMRYFFSGLEELKYLKSIYVSIFSG